MVDQFVFSYVIIPLLIFFARIADVTLGTLRIVYISQGKRKFAPIVGFFEVFIWIVAMGQIMADVNNYYYYFAYAAGFASGNYIGLYLENKFTSGLLIMRIIIPKENTQLVKILKDEGRGLISLDAVGTENTVNLLIFIIRKRRFQEIRDLIMTHEPKAFISTENAYSLDDGVNSAPMRLHEARNFKRRLTKKK